MDDAQKKLFDDDLYAWKETKYAQCAKDDEESTSACKHAGALRAFEMKQRTTDKFFAKSGDDQKADKEAFKEKVIAELKRLVDEDEKAEAAKKKAAAAKDEKKKGDKGFKCAKAADDCGKEDYCCGTAKDKETVKHTVCAAKADTKYDNFAFTCLDGAQRVLAAASAAAAAGLMLQ